jgi:hypothetical protein
MNLKQPFFILICFINALHGSTHMADHGQDSMSKIQRLEKEDCILGADITLLKKTEECGGVFRVNRAEVAYTFVEFTPMAF